jgi:hypothetical protein
MKKTEKKIENLITSILQPLCENRLKSWEGFLHITHEVNFKKFPESLQIKLVFDNQQNSKKAQIKFYKEEYDEGLVLSFKAAGVSIKAVKKVISFKA